MNLSVMAIGAHPDDIEISMFGALAIWRDLGARLGLVVVTDGSKGGLCDPARLSAIRKAEAREAAALLGAEPVFLDLPDGELVADATLVAGLKQAIGAAEPDLVITHAGNDYHGDHRAVSQAVGIAASFSTPVLWADTPWGTGFSPTHYIDVTRAMDRKRQAILAHGSQDPERFVSKAEAMGRFRSSQCNVLDGYAEAYRFEPQFPFADIRDLLPPAPPVLAVRDRAKPGVHSKTH